MRDFVVYPLVGISAFLYIYLLSRLLKGYVREYFGLLFYVIVLVLTLATDIATYKFADRSAYFLVSETARWGALYLAVLSFVWKALAAHPAHGWIRHWLIGLSVLTVFVAVFFTRSANVPIWILRTVNILSVAGMLLNLVLWTLLVRTRSADLTLFLVTSGLGVQAAMEAVAWSMRNLQNRTLFQAAYYPAMLGHLLCLTVWILAFRKPAVQHAKA